MLVQACGDEELRRWLPDLPRPYSLADARAYVELVSEGWQSGAQFVFAVIARTTGQPVGSTRVGRSLGGATAGYWTAPWARRMGVASRALRLVSTWALGVGLSPIRLYIAPSNLASQRVALAVGFVIDEHDRIIDDEGEPGDRVFILQAAK